MTRQPTREEIAEAKGVPPERIVAQPWGGNDWRDGDPGLGSDDDGGGDVSRETSDEGEPVAETDVDDRSSTTCAGCGGPVDAPYDEVCPSCAGLIERGLIDDPRDDAIPTPDDDENGPRDDETAPRSDERPTRDRDPPPEPVEPDGQLALGESWGTVEKPKYEIPPVDEIRECEGETGLTLISTFSGCGGTSAGFRWAGFDVRWASEFVDAARETYEANWPSTPVDPRDIRDVSGDEILDAAGLERGDVDVLEGGPPCAAFSMAGNRDHDSDEVKRYSDTEQRVDDLFWEFARLVDELAPRVFVIENVPSLVTGAAEAVFRKILRTLRAIDPHGYVVDARTLDASKHGVPQRRRRLFIQGVRRDLVDEYGVRPAYPRPLRYRYSIRDACPWLEYRGAENSDGDGPPVVDVDGEPYRVLQATGRGGATEPIGEPAPTIMTHGNLHTFSERGVVFVHDDEWPADLGQYAIGDAWEDLEPGESSEKYFQLIRPDPDEPCPTVTQAGGDISAASVTHPIVKRKFSIPELRRICGFPDDFVLTGTFAQRWERLGRAVPPPCSRRLAAAIRDEIFGEIGSAS